MAESIVAPVSSLSDSRAAGRDDQKESSRRKLKEKGLLVPASQVVDVMIGETELESVPPQSRLSLCMADGSVAYVGFVTAAEASAICCHFAVADCLSTDMQGIEPADPAAVKAKRDSTNVASLADFMEFRQRNSNASVDGIDIAPSAGGDDSARDLTLWLTYGPGFALNHVALADVDAIHSHFGLAAPFGNELTACQLLDAAIALCTANMADAAAAQAIKDVPAPTPMPLQGAVEFAKACAAWFVWLAAKRDRAYIVADQRAIAVCDTERHARAIIAAVPAQGERVFVTVARRCLVDVQLA